MIPAEAVDAAYDKFRHLDITTSDVEGILEAAAPRMMAEAWREGYSDAWYQERGYPLDGTQSYGAPLDLGEEVGEWNRYTPARPTG